jgi:hypothetical protein
MEFVELTDKQRKMILDHLGSHVTSVYYEVNLNILTALYDPESNQYLTMSYYVSCVVTQCDPEIGYILIHGDEVGNFIYTGQSKDPIFQKMCSFYESKQGRKERDTLEKKLLAQYALTYEGEPVAYARDYLQWYLKNKMQNGAE